MSVENKVEQAVEWIRLNRERFWAITGTILLTFLLIALLVRQKQKEADEAWFQLGSLQSQLAQNQFAEARKGFEAWETRFSGTSAATYAQFLKADLAYRTTDFVQAASLYQQIAQTGKPPALQPLAYSAQVSSEEMQGHLAEALTLSQSFLDKYPDHFLAGSMLLTQARLQELTGNTAGAVTAYERFILLYPQDPSINFAKNRTQTLSQK